MKREVFDQRCECGKLACLLTPESNEERARLKEVRRRVQLDDVRVIVNDLPGLPDPDPEVASLAICASEPPACGWMLFTLVGEVSMRREVQAEYDLRNGARCALHAEVDDGEPRESVALAVARWVGMALFMRKYRDGCVTVIEVYPEAAASGLAALLKAG